MPPELLLPPPPPPAPAAAPAGAPAPMDTDGSDGGTAGGGGDAMAGQSQPQQQPQQSQPPYDAEAVDAWACGVVLFLLVSGVRPGKRRPSLAALFLCVCGRFLTFSFFLFLPDATKSPNHS
jgi:hypothetical protein